MVVVSLGGWNQQPQWKRPAAGAYGPWQGKTARALYRLRP